MRKQLLEEGISLFNEKPTKGVTFMQKHGLITISDHESLITLLKGCPRFDKAKIGEYIGDYREDSIREAFVASFHFENKVCIVNSVRLFVSSLNALF